MNSVTPVSGPGLRKARASRFRLELALAPLVLVGDHDRHLTRAVAAAFRRKGYRVRTFNSAEELVSQLWENRGDLDEPEHVVVGIAHYGQTVLDEMGALALESLLPPTTALVPDGETELADVVRMCGASRVIDRSRALDLLPKAVFDVVSVHWGMDD